MAGRLGALFSAAVLVTGVLQSARAEQQSVGQHVVPLKVPSKLATDRRFETISGDPKAPGAPFVVRIHAEAGYVIMPHTHEVDENIVVVMGSWALGMGTQYRRDALEAMEVGDYGFAPKNMVHFALSKTATVIQVHGTGPFATRWLQPMYELSNKGVVLKTTADDPGQLQPVPPSGCFTLAIGTRVRTGRREGVLIGAQCTPGQLTQYRVERSDGEPFWAQSADLTAF